MSLEIDPEQPAFPRTYSADGHNGMTLRDWLAGQALAGLCANSGGPFQRCDQSGWTMVNCGHEHVADECYRLADAMMQARRSPALTPHIGDTP